MTIVCISRLILWKFIMNINDRRLQPLNYSLIKVRTQKETNNYFFIIKFRHAQAQTCTHTYGWIRYNTFLLFPLWYHKEIRLTGIKYCIHPNKRWQFFQIYHLTNAGLPLNIYKRHMFYVGILLQTEDFELGSSYMQGCHVFKPKQSTVLCTEQHMAFQQPSIRYIKDFILHTKICLTIMHLSTASLNFSSSFCSDSDFTKLLSNKLHTFSPTACFWITVIASLAQCSASL